MADAGQLEVTVTDLAMTKPPHYRVVPRPPGKLALFLAEGMTVSFYRYLYNSVGERWFWWERRAMADDDLASIIKNEKVEIYVLYVDGVPAGFTELDYTEYDKDRSVEISILGLIPEYIGKGYGLYLASWAVDGIWRREPEQLSTSITSFDHPRAAGLLQKVGFSAVNQRVEHVTDPRTRGLIDPAAPLPHVHHDTEARAGPHTVITPLPFRRD